MEFTITFQNQLKECHVSTGVTIQGLLEHACIQFGGCNHVGHRLEFDGHVFPKTTVLSDDQCDAIDVSLVDTRDAVQLWGIVEKFICLPNPITANCLRKIGHELDALICQLPETGGVLQIAQRLATAIRLNKKIRKVYEDPSEGNSIVLKALLSGNNGSDVTQLVADLRHYM